MPKKRKPTKPSAARHPAVTLIEAITKRPSASILHEGVKTLRKGEAGEHAAPLREAMTQAFARVLSAREPSGYAIRVNAEFRRLSQPPGRGGQRSADQPQLYDERGITPAGLEDLGRTLTERGITALPFLADGEPNPAFQNAPKRPD